MSIFFISLEILIVKVFYILNRTHDNCLPLLFLYLSQSNSLRFNDVNNATNAAWREKWQRKLQTTVPLHLRTNYAQFKDLKNVNTNVFSFIYNNYFVKTIQVQDVISHK